MVEVVVRCSVLYFCRETWRATEKHDMLQCVALCDAGCGTGHLVCAAVCVAVSCKQEASSGEI